MTLNVNNIRAALTGGGARPTLFRVFITTPSSPVADAKFQFLCKSAQIPGSTIGPIEVPYMGARIKVAGDRQFTDWAVTIINDEDFLIRDALEGWMQAIRGHISNSTNSFASPNPESYKTKATVQQLSKNGNVIRNYDMYGLWPNDVSAIEMGWDQADTIEEFSINFQIDYWTVSGITGTGGGTASN